MKRKTLEISHLRFGKIEFEFLRFENVPHSTIFRRNYTKHFSAPRILDKKWIPFISYMQEIGFELFMFNHG